MIIISLVKRSKCWEAVDYQLTFLFEGKVFRQMPAFVVAPQQVQGGRVANFQRPQVEDALPGRSWNTKKENRLDRWHPLGAPTVRAQRIDGWRDKEERGEWE